MAHNTKALREEQGRIFTNARAKIDEITDDTPEERAAEIEREHDAMMVTYDEIGVKILRFAKLDDAEAAAKAAAEAGDSRRPNGDGRANGGGDDKAPEYRDVFSKALRFGIAALDDYERPVLMEGRADLPPEMRAQSVGTDTAGGFTVPEEFSGEIDKAMAAWGPMWEPGIARELNTSHGRVIKWPTIDDTGLTGRIKAENADVDDDGTDDMVFAEKQLDAYVYDTGMVKMPIELLQDSAFNMESLLNELFGERLGRLANTTLTTGTGSSQPNGIVTASSLGVTTASTEAFTFDEVIDLFHSIDPAYRGSPLTRWMFNDTTLKEIRKLKDGDGNYLWQMGDVRTGEPDRILAKPYSINQAMANSGTDSPDGGEKVMLFGDFSRFIVRKVMGFQVITLRERYAEAFQIGMVGFKRFDSEMLNTAAVKHMLFTGG